MRTQSLTTRPHEARNTARVAGWHLAIALITVLFAQSAPLPAGADERKFDAVQPPEGDANTPPQNADRQVPGGAQTAPMPKDAMPVASQVSDPALAGGNQGVKQAPSQQAAPEGSGAQPQNAAPNAGPPAAAGP